MQKLLASLVICSFICLPVRISAQTVTMDEPISPEKKPTIAITTFENLSAYPENAWVAMSFSESLTAKLKRLYERFRVVERTRVYEIIKEQGFDPERLYSLETTKHRNAGNLIGANYIILGSVSIQGNAEDMKTPLMANMRLVDVQTGEIRESQAIQGEVERLFELETQLAFALLKQMRIELTPEEAEKISLKETISIFADKYYNLGQQAYYANDYETAKILYDKALETVSGNYYQTAELGLIETLKLQKSIADEAQKVQIKEEALRRREESKRSRSEANQRFFAEAKYCMLQGDYESAIENYQKYLDLAKPFRHIKWKQENSLYQFHYLPIIYENAIYTSSFENASEGEIT